jgi:hypothetical protein
MGASSLEAKKDLEAKGPLIEPFAPSSVEESEPAGDRTIVLQQKKGGPKRSIRLLFSSDLEIGIDSEHWQQYFWKPI